MMLRSMYHAVRGPSTGRGRRAFLEELDRCSAARSKVSEDHARRGEFSVLALRLRRHGAVAARGRVSEGDGYGRGADQHDAAAAHRWDRHATVWVGGRLRPLQQPPNTRGPRTRQRARRPAAAQARRATGERTRPALG